MSEQEREQEREAEQEATEGRDEPGPEPEPEQERGGELDSLIADLQDLAGMTDEDLEGFTTKRSRYEFLRHQVKNSRRPRKSGNRPVAPQPTGRKKTPLEKSLVEVNEGQSMRWVFEPDQLFAGDYTPNRGGR
jgi:hypothetical protein